MPTDSTKIYVVIIDGAKAVNDKDYDKSKHISSQVIQNASLSSNVFSELFSFIG